MTATKTKMTASQVATTMPQLLARVDELEKEAKDLRFQLNRQNSWIQLLITGLLSSIRWAYAWSKSRGDQTRMANFKAQGEALNSALEEIEPKF